MEKVEQVDREAVASLWPEWAREEILKGAKDSSDEAQAFARHRIEATRANDEEIARLKSALERSIGALDEMGLVHTADSFRQALGEPS